MNNNNNIIIIICREQRRKNRFWLAVLEFEKSNLTQMEIGKWGDISLLGLIIKVMFVMHAPSRARGHEELSCFDLYFRESKLTALGGTKVLFRDCNEKASSIHTTHLSPCVLFFIPIIYR